MTKQKLTGLSASLMQVGDQPAVPSEATPRAPRKPVVQTVKLPDHIFVRLKTLSALERRSNQDILLTALCDYLDKRGG